MRTRRVITSAIVVIGGVAGVAGIIGGLLPWLARTGYAGAVIRENVEYGRDATPLFYTESERTTEILRRERRSSVP